MMIPRSFWFIAAAIVTLLASILWALGVIPWWGVLIAVPVATVALVAVLFMMAVGAWMAGGSH